MNRKEFIFKNKITFMGLLAFISFKVQAVLPPPPATAGGTAAGGGSSDYLTVIKDFAGIAIENIGLIIAGAAFSWIAWITIAKFNDARKDRAEWAEVMLSAVAGAGVLVFMAFLLNESKNVIGGAVP